VGLGRVEAARRAFQASAELSPKDPTSYVNLGSLELTEAANADAARRYFSEALSIDPSSAAAREGLAVALEALGQRGRAHRVRAGSPTPTGRR
jgi:Flp pilus assembly protein TadD